MWASLSNWIAACGRILDFADWGDPERIAANVMAAYGELDPSLPRPAPPELFARMAAWRAAH